MPSESIGMCNLILFILFDQTLIRLESAERLISDQRLQFETAFQSEILIKTFDRKSI